MLSILASPPSLIFPTLGVPKMLKEKVSDVLFVFSLGARGALPYLSGIFHTWNCILSR